MIRTSMVNNKKCLCLIQMFEQLVQIIGSKDISKEVEFVTNLLQKEQTSRDILADCKSNINRLREKECVILVAGETSAGKSSFLNLLLGSEFLPTYTCSCTSFITTLRYGPQKEARIIYGGPKSKVDVIKNLDKEGMERLYEITFMKEKEREAHNVKEVQVYLPQELLKCGIVLAETPFIGENEILEQYVMDFISNNQILGLIYIICSDFEGGIKGYRGLLLLLKMIIEQQKNDSKALKFNPNDALILANKFDAVQEEDREKVKRNILDQLGKYWPEFDESMTVFFSTKTALRDVAVHPGFVNDDYKTLLLSISNLFSLAMDRRIKTSDKWIRTVLQRLNHFLKTVTILDMTQRDHQDYAVNQQMRLQNLKERSNDVVSELLADISERSEHIFREIQKYLSTPQAKLLLCSVWKPDEIPKLEEKITDVNRWLWVKQRVDDAFFDRLCNAIEDWNDKESTVSYIITEIVENGKSKLGILQNEIANVEHDLRCPRRSYNGLKNLRRALRLPVILPRGQLIEEPLKFALHMQHPVTNNPFEKMRHRRKAGSFERDTQAWTSKRAERLMWKLLANKPKDISEVGLLTKLVDQLMRRPRDIVERLKQRIQCIIDTNIELLNSIQNLVVTQRRGANKYEEMMVLIEGLKESLIYIFVHDFESNELKVLQDSPAGQSLAQTFRFFSELVTGGSSNKGQEVTNLPLGTWTIVRQGTLKRDGKATPVSIKMYMPSSGISHTFQEVAKMRCLLNKRVYLAEFLGIYHIEAVTPAYIFDGHLLPLHQYATEAANFRNCLPILLREIADGVHYLHSKGMVHMMLKKSTVTVTESGEVRLTGACVPRHATLPLEKEIPVSDFVYLAPEVLRKELYITSADVYGYGLLVYELLCEREAFQEQRKSTLKDFAERVNPEKMLHLLTHISACLTEGTIKLITQCVQISEDDRPNMHVVIEMLKGNFRKEVTRRRPEMHTPVKLFRRPRKCEKNTH
ncbi:uncharacterized protein LOC132742365 [Ruditapes philippinarum]|uniref:uncharacterized protein LOC132742365 n=1 Tax=Ruditapes philippinarum TaxID=129788 RepID=UPI00295BBDC9|nr:uncharacterized protein LOC132742365 [Ruditapes philippinarum]